MLFRSMSEHRALWAEAFAKIDVQGSVFVHRDYHAQNLFWLPARQGLARVGMIDFQDALAGNRSYDVISLLEDARRDVSPELAAAMKAHYLTAMKEQGRALDGESWTAEAAITAAQRNAKIAGIFSRLASRDGKSRYLAHLPRVWRYLEGDLRHPSLANLQNWYDTVIPRETREGPRHEGAVV